MIVRILLVIIVLYIPYSARLPESLGIPGINVLTMLFLAVLSVKISRPATQAAHAPLKRSFTAFIACLFFAALVGIARDDGSILEDAIYLKNSVFYLLLYFLYFHCISSKEDARIVVAAILSVALLGMMHAIRQGLDYGLDSFQWTHRASGPFAIGWTEANRAGVYFSMFTPGFLAIALYYRRHFWIQVGAWAALPIGAFATFVTYSRQSYFILALLSFLLLARRSWYIVIPLVVLLSTFDSWAPTSAVQRIEMTEQKVTDPNGLKSSQSSGDRDSELDVSTESRFILWKGAWQMIQESPWGVGLNRFQTDIGNFSPIRLDAHNGFILTAAETGVQGLAMLLVLIFGLLQLGWSMARWRADPECLTLGMIFTIATLGVVLGNMYGSPFYYGNLMGDYWALAGVAARYRWMQLHNNIAEHEATPASGPTRSPLFRRTFANTKKLDVRSSR